MIKVGQVVAVYGSLRNGLHNHPIIDGAPYLGTAELNGFVMRSLGPFPYIHEGEPEVPLTVELYVVDSEQRAADLDMLEGYPDFYDRKQVQTSKGSAWVYFINDYDDEEYTEVTSGDWLEHTQSRDH